jgi:hypothetical protein
MGFVLPVFTGSVLVFIALIFDWLVGQPFRPFAPIQLTLFAAGAALIGSGLLQHVNRVAGISVGICLPILSVVLFLGLGEAVFRVIQFDFRNQEKAWRTMAPFFRQPIVPTGKGLFRRGGPERWSGQVLRSYVEQLGYRPNPYENEPIITVEYDQNGFRNPEGMKSWEIAVAGDSFTELGNLPYDQLFTTSLGRALGVSVLNLGVSYTGSITQLGYLQDYGFSPATRHFVIVFFEGNDLDDLGGEYESLMRWNRTGERDYREFTRQSSLVTFLYHQSYRMKQRMLAPQPPRERNVVTAYFKSPDGNLPVTLSPSDAAPAVAELSPPIFADLRYFFREYSALGKDRHVTTWVAYMPTKLRVLHGRLEFSESTIAKFPKLKRIENWPPNDLPELISGLSREHGVGFINLTPALIEETSRTGKLLYNGLFDTHLNAAGSAVVARELARQVNGAR